MESHNVYRLPNIGHMLSRWACSTHWGDGKFKPQILLVFQLLMKRPHRLWNQNVRYRFHNSTPLDEIFSHLSSVHTVSPQLFVPFYYPPVYRYRQWSVLFTSYGLNLLYGVSQLTCVLHARSIFSLTSAFGHSVKLASHLQVSQVVVLRSSSRNMESYRIHACYVSRQSHSSLKSTFWSKAPKRYVKLNPHCELLNEKSVRQAHLPLLCRLFQWATCFDRNKQPIGTTVHNKGRCARRTDFSFTVFFDR